MSLQIRKKLICSVEGQILFWKPFNRDQYQIELGLSGAPEELDRVKSVTYKLHPTFRNPLRRSSNREDNFSIRFWTWGTFMIDVSIFMKNGDKETRNYYLTYELPADDGTNYVEVKMASR